MAVFTDGSASWMTWWRLPRPVMRARMSSSVSWRTGYGAQQGSRVARNRQRDGRVGGFVPYTFANVSLRRAASGKSDGYRIVMGCIPGSPGIWDGAG